MSNKKTIRYHFNKALLPDGWQSNVSVTVNDLGNISTIEINESPNNADTILDCVIPCMPNCHSHVFQRTMAGLTEYKTSDNDSFWSWRELMYQYANQITPDHLYHIAKYAYTEMLNAGFSSVCEFHYVHRDLDNSNDTVSMSQAIIKAAHEVGMQLTLLPVLYTQSHIDGSPLSELQQRFKLSTDEYIELYQSLQKSLYPEQNMGLCFHSLRAVSIQQMKQVLKVLGVEQPIHIHISEQMAEVNQVKEHTGMRPVELLFHHFDVNEHWCLVHATHLNEKEIQMISKSGAVAGLCPITEANLGDGAFPLSSFLHNNGRYAIGSDSHVLINPFQELQILEYSQRLKQQQRIIASSTEQPHVGTYLWNHAVKSGAQSCGAKVAGIDIGHKANWISIDVSHPLLINLNGQMCLDNMIFADNTIAFECYIKGRKLANMTDDVIENYKNTLKCLR